MLALPADPGMPGASAVALARRSPLLATGAYCICSMSMIYLNKYLFSAGAGAVADAPNPVLVQLLLLLLQVRACGASCGPRLPRQTPATRAQNALAVALLLLLLHAVRLIGPSQPVTVQSIVQCTLHRVPRALSMAISSAAVAARRTGLPLALLFFAMLYSNSCALGRLTVPVVTVFKVRHCTGIARPRTSWTVRPSLIAEPGEHPDRLWGPALFRPDRERGRAGQSAGHAGRLGAHGVDGPVL